MPSSPSSLSSSPTACPSTASASRATGSARTAPTRHSSSASSATSPTSGWPWPSPNSTWPPTRLTRRGRNARPTPTAGCSAPASPSRAARRSQLGAHRPLDVARQPRLPAEANATAAVRRAASPEAGLPAGPGAAGRAREVGCPAGCTEQPATAGCPASRAGDSPAHSDWLTAAPPRPLRLPEDRRNSEPELVLIRSTGALGSDPARRPLPARDHGVQHVEWGAEHRLLKVARRSGHGRIRDSARSSQCFSRACRSTVAV